ncbi:MAG: C_GCAxxG_C_C family protein [Clostridia bacterium]|nr:C_GCAxxG_C_C family protein [Clostridia bacterium]
MEELIDILHRFGDVLPEYTERADAAKQAFLSGYNCAQSVLLSFLDKTNSERDVALKFAQPFGGGLSRMREVCGAVSGGALTLGAIYGSDELLDTESKTKVYRKTQLFGNRFQELNGSVVCRELLGLTEKCSPPVPDKRTDEYYKKRPCAELVWLAAMLIAQIVG